MKKLIVSTLAAAILATMASGAQAANTFNVTIALTSNCTVDTSATAADFTYTSFQAADATFSSSFNIKCTKNLPITSVSLDTLSVTDNATDLAYTLALSGAPATGSGAAQSVTVGGTMVAGQAGTCGSGSCTNAAATNKTRTVTVAF